MKKIVIVICDKCNNQMTQFGHFGGLDFYGCNECKLAKSIDQKTGKPWINKNYTKRGA